MAAPPIAERHLHHFHRRSPIKESVRAATTANITIATALNNGDSLDGVTLATDDRVLVKNQSSGAENGLYIVGATPVRAYDQSTDDPAFGFLVYVREGTSNGGVLYKNTNTSTPTIDTTSLTFAAITGGAVAASSVTVTDSGGYFTGSDVEAVLQELAAKVIGYQAHGNLGSTETFSAVTAGWHSGTVNADCTFTFSAAASGILSSMVLELTQDGTGGHALTLPGSVVGDFTAYDTTAGTTSLLMFFSRDGGTTWYGFIAGGSGGSTSPLTTKGDLWGFSTVDARLPVGTNGYLLKANSSATLGVSYADPSTTGHYEILMASGSADPLLTSDGLDYLYVWVP